MKSQSVSQRTFSAHPGPGFSSAVQADPRHLSARKRELPVQVRFAEHECMVQTREGQVQASAGDAIITGAFGETWPVRRERFAEKYRESAPGQFVSLPKDVLALEMDTPFCAVLSDGVSTLHGAAGDFLIAYNDGSLGIVAAHIFSVIYEVVPS
ncbi:MAG: PGDYG domain-containing protein [Pseudomonadota bacterium]